MNVLVLVQVELPQDVHKVVSSINSPLSPTYQKSLKELKRQSERTLSALGNPSPQITVPATADL